MIRGIYISPADGSGFRYVAMRSPKNGPRLLWFIVPADMRRRERHIHPSRIPAHIKECAYNALNGV